MWYFLYFYSLLLQNVGSSKQHHMTDIYFNQVHQALFVGFSNKYDLIKKYNIPITNMSIKHNIFFHVHIVRSQFIFNSYF